MYLSASKLAWFCGFVLGYINIIDRCRPGDLICCILSLRRAVTSILLYILRAYVCKCTWNTENKVWVSPLYVVLNICEDWMKAPEAGGDSWTAVGLRADHEVSLPWSVESCAASTVLLNASLSKGTHPADDTQLQLWVPAVRWGTQEGAAVLGPICAGAAPVWVGKVWWHCAEVPGRSWALESPPAPGWLLLQQGELPAITHMLRPKQWGHLTFKILVRRKLVSCLVFLFINVFFSYSPVTTINS